MIISMTVRKHTSSQPQCKNAAAGGAAAVLSRTEVAGIIPFLFNNEEQ